MSVQEAQEKVSSSEFTDWTTFFELQWGETEKSEYYLAQIASLIVQTNSKEPEKWPMDKFMFRVSVHDGPTTEHKKEQFHIDNLDSENYTRLSKKKWLAICGLKK